MTGCLAALLCIVTRALLHVSDRSIFRRPETNMQQALFMNTLFPFLISIIVCLAYHLDLQAMFALVPTKAAFFAAAGSQIAGIAFSYALREMRVQHVAISAKLADIFIPLALFALTLRFSGWAYLASILSVLIFWPSLHNMLTKKDHIKFKWIVRLVAVVLLQAVINDFFQTSALTKEWLSFLAFMVAIFFWRTIMGLVPMLATLRQTSAQGPSRKTAYLLFSRALLAFVAQTAFFFAITRPSNELVWPLLNGAPLASCFAAHLCLGEPIQEQEKSSLILFTLFVAAQMIFMRG